MQVHGEGHPITLTAKGNVGCIMSRADRFQESVALLQETTEDCARWALFTFFAFLPPFRLVFPSCPRLSQVPCPDLLVD